jgi:pimeloyl-ACP methyl ester carboxylesterase
MTGIHYRVQGAGPVAVLLHGFPMNSQVWNNWAKSLSQHVMVYTPDLPGFGKSEAPDRPFSIQDIANAMNVWMDQLDLDNAVIIGHSMGGYVALKMVEQRPERFRGLVLFHSTALADSAEKKESRTKVLKFIEDNGVEAFTSNFIAPLYADPSNPSIPEVRGITIQASADAVAGYTIAMRDREDTTRVLRDFKNPVLFLAGDKDGGIPVTTIEEQSRIGEHIRSQILKDTGHMGMFERPEETLTTVKTFIFNLEVG